MKKRTKRLLALPVIGAAFFTEELYRYIFRKNSSTLFTKIFDSKGHEEEYYEYKKELRVKFEEIHFEEYAMPSVRGDELKGYFYDNGADGKKIAFVIHGYRSNHIDTTSMYYDLYKEREIDVFTCDHTAAGNSEGDYIGFDVFEAADCLKWIDFLKDKFGEGIEIILHGFSMGAATVMQMSSKCPSNVKFIVEDSGYINAKASLDHQVGIMYEPLRAINKVFGKYDLNDSDVTMSLLSSDIPMLFVHGKDDKLVPYENGSKLFEMYRGEKDSFFPEDTRHIEAIYTEPDEYGRKIDSFIEKYL